MLPFPRIENSKFPEAREWEKNGGHRKLYRFSPDDYKDVTESLDRHGSGRERQPRGG
jgi:hypothetical protein